jgi:hypothetical protein
MNKNCIMTPFICRLKDRNMFYSEDGKGQHVTCIFWNVSLELTITDIGVVRSAALQYFSVSQTS